MTPGEQARGEQVSGEQDPGQAGPDVPELRESQPSSSGPQTASGGMGVSSERVAVNGDDPRPSTDGTKDTSATPPAAEDAPGHVRGEREVNPAEMGVKAGFPSADPRSKDHPFQGSEGRGPGS